MALQLARVAAFSSGVAPYQVYLMVFGSGALVMRLMMTINTAVRTNKIFAVIEPVECVQKS